MYLSSRAARSNSAGSHLAHGRLGVSAWMVGVWGRYATRIGAAVLQGCALALVGFTDNVVWLLAGFFGLLQFVSTFLIAWYYARFAGRQLDPLADSIRNKMEEGAE